MFETLQMAPPDAILGLTEAFKNDSNPDKINLGVGVYKDAQGATPTLKAVQAAERQLVEANSGKSYLAIDGLPSYRQHIPALLWGETHPRVAENRAVSVQTPGGTGGLRVAADFLRQKAGVARMWCSKPTWANHPNIFKAAGLQVETYNYLDDSGRALDFAAMMDSLQNIPAGDAICLHACCHNPSGVDPSLEQWKEIAQTLRERKILPLVDFAYQGFGDGMDEDAAGLRTLSEAGGDLLVCTSYSKNFGLYSERIGGLTVSGDSAETVGVAHSQVKACVRANYSNPPRHGAAIVAAILSDAELRGQWEQELAEMRQRIQQMRSLFVETMKQHAPEHDFSFIARQRGMFSFSGLTRMQVDQLKSQHSIYIVGSGRINVAGMTEANMPRLCQAIAGVL